MEVEIKKFDHFGRGISKVDNKIVFVNYALPNEIVDIIISNDKKKYSIATIKKIISESKERIEPCCPYYYQCGGCHFLHTNYEQEINFKISKANELLGKCDAFYKTKGLNYRNKVSLHVDKNQVGFYAEKSKQLVNIDYCYLLNDKINQVIKDLKNVDLSKYNIKKIIIRSHQNQILLWTDSYVNDDFIDCFSYVDTIICNNKIIKGKGYIEENINGKIFKITSEAFFQVNKEGLEQIYQVIASFLKQKNINNALDLYSGTALWSILVCNLVKNIVAIEINKEACQNAKDNLIKNNIHNVQIINGDVKDYISKFKNIDLVIIDPPRSGLDKKSLEYLKKINSKYIIYISCDIQTLKRDLTDLKQIYNLLNVNMIDMFKRTYHCEVVTILERTNK